MIVGKTTGTVPRIVGIIGKTDAIAAKMCVTVGKTVGTAARTTGIDARIVLIAERTIVIVAKIEPITGKTAGTGAKIVGIIGKNIAGGTEMRMIKEVITLAESITGADTAREHAGNNQISQRLGSLPAARPLSPIKP